MTEIQINDLFNSLGCQEQILEFYEVLRHSSNESLEQFQSILEVFVTDILKYRKEIKRIEDSYRREKDMNEKFLKTIEEDQERDMRQLEESIRQEERQKFELERETILQRTSKEIQDLQSNLHRLKFIEKIYTERKNEEDSSTSLLREEIARLTEENQTLNASLNDSLTANVILQSDLQSVKSQLNDRQTMLLQEKQSSSSNHRERESLQINVRQLVEVNKQLRDENDSLRAIIETNKYNSLSSPTDPLTPQRLLSNTGSTLGSYWNKSRLDKSSRTPLATANQQHSRESFDLGSADELGISDYGSRFFPKSLVTVPSTKISSLVKSSADNNLANRNNVMNDSGLSLTTARDATEVDSDHEIKVNNAEQLRVLISKKDKDDTESDDVFRENQLIRKPSKRFSQRRISKKLMISDQISQDLVFDRMFKVVFCGDAAVGKSALIMRLCKGQFHASTISTLGVDFQNKQIDVDGKRVALQLWDTAGQERFRSVAKSYFRRCDGVILVYDTTYERSFLNVREWINTITDSTPKKVSVMIVANKIDLRDQMRAEGKRVIEHAEGIKLAKEHRALFIETSAKDGTNTNEALIELTRDMQCNEDLERFRTAGIALDKQASKKSICCGS